MAVALPPHSAADSIAADAEEAGKGQLIAQQLLLAALKRGELAVEAPEIVDSNAWVYEHFRSFAAQLNILVGLLGSTEACTATTCPIMCCGEQQYLCASHPQPRECCAMDYMSHTVDAAQALLAGTAAFPSRVTIKASAMPLLVSQARRLYRALSHAWRHHRELYDSFEAETRCTARFTALARRYSLLAEEQLVIRA